jgi:hypothetical protein
MIINWPSLFQPFPANTSNEDEAHPMIGVEQEFELFAGGTKLDFQALFPRAIKGTRAVPFRNCDSAVIVESGYMLANDGREAEFATAPIRSGADGCLSLADEVSRCREHLLRTLHALDIDDVRGYSTHLNISVPIGRESEIAAIISTTAAPALILLMEAKQSPGLLLRPRRGRLEVGSEYIDDKKQLAAAAVFLTGVILAYLGQTSNWNKIPKIRLKRSEAANIRAGIFLPHDAYGESLHALGREARLELESGETIKAGEVLAICSDLACRELEGRVSKRSLDNLRQLVAQSGSLQIERHANPGAIKRRRASVPAAEALILQKFISRRDAPGLRPRFLDWSGAAFSWKKADTTRIIGVPWAHLPEFFNAARKNELPKFVEKLGPAEATLNSIDQFQEPQVFENIDPVALGDQALNDNRKYAGSGGLTKPAQQLRPNDPETNTPSILENPVKTPRFPRRALITLLIGLVILILTIGGGVLVFKMASQRPTATQPGNVGIPIRPVITSMVFTKTFNPTLTPTTPGNPGTTKENVNCRSGPGTAFPILSMVPAGTPVTVSARSEDGLWWQVSPCGHASGWVFATFIVPGFDPSALPVLAGPPLPPGVSTDTPVPFDCAAAYGTSSAACTADPRCTYVSKTCVNK